MDPIQQHLISKLLADRAQQLQHHQPPSQVPPPPYEDSENGSEADDDSDDEQDSSTSPPLKLTVDATHTIKGSGNLVPTSPTSTTDATKLSVVLLNALNNLNATASNDAGRPKQTLKVDLTINCGITIIGDRNVVGNIGLRPRSPVALQGLNSPTGNVAVGAKRKADGDEDKVRDEPEAKRVAIKREDGL